MSESKNVVKSDAKTAKAPVSARKVPGNVIRKLGTTSKKAHTAIAKYDSTEAIRADAIAGLEHVRSIVATKQEGAKSRFGHMMSCQNGVLDEAILNCGDNLDFGSWLKAVAKAECKSRGTKVDDNAGLARRSRDHVLSLAGMTHIGEVNLPKRLLKIGLAHKTEEIMGALGPLALLFDIWHSECSF